MLRREMERLLAEQAPGPHPSFAVAHALSAILLIGDSRIGRQRLAARLFMGEGEARTLLKRLVKEKLITTDRLGCRLTRRGQALREEARGIFYTFRPKPGGFLAKETFGVGVRGAGTFAVGIAERDEAIKAGAEGALTLVCEGGELLMPGLENLSRQHPELAGSILASSAPRSGDAIVVCWGKEAASVEYGALNAAWSLYERSSRRTETKRGES